MLAVLNILGIISLYFILSISRFKMSVLLKRKSFLICYVIYFITFYCLIIFAKYIVYAIPKSIWLVSIFLFFVCLFVQLVASIFFLIDDITMLCLFIIRKISKVSKPQTENKIARLTFLKYIGLGMSSLLGIGLFYGLSNKYNYKKYKVNLKFKNLPSDFDGLKIVQISDIHSGSLADVQSVEKGIKMILEEKPDIIFFTGDLVNDKAVEFENVKTTFQKLHAPLGIYSILGNHDYGKYAEWDSEQAEMENLEYLKQHHHDLNWRLLLNENIILKKQNSEISLIGVENWSLKKFVSKGDLKKAMRGVPENNFQILLSHDPSHWDAEINKKYKSIDLTLSGHTHGMQFGIETPFLKWSPIQYLYKQWAGLYQKHEQFLYVNRGFGFIGYQGRLGILPEITVMTLNKA